MKTRKVRLDVIKDGKTFKGYRVIISDNLERLFDTLKEAEWYKQNIEPMCEISPVTFKFTKEIIQ